LPGRAVAHGGQPVRSRNAWASTWHQRSVNISSRLWAAAAGGTAITSPAGPAGRRSRSGSAVGRSSPSMLALDALRLAVLGLASGPQMPALLNRQIEQLGDAPLWLTELDELADRSSHPRLQLGDLLA